MNIHKIINIFKKCDKISLFRGKDVQWISDGRAVYPLWKLPLFDEQSLVAAYDLPSSEKVELHDALPATYDFSDAATGEEQVFYEKIQLPIVRDNSLISLATRQGVTFINKKYLDPIEDDGYISLWERKIESGESYIVVKRGMMLEAVIMPVVHVLQKEFLDELQELTHRLVSTYNVESGSWLFR